MSVSAATYERLALEDPDHVWELDCGRLRQKPPMTYAHNDLMFELAHRLRLQLDPGQYRVRVNSARVVYGAARYYVPDVCVVPVTVTGPLRDQPDALERYAEPLPLVVEVWSPSTGGYDVDAKVPEYQRRGDGEIWRIHPRERTLTFWRRQTDGRYTEHLYQTGVVQPATLPDVSIDLDALFTGLEPGQGPA
jgi:Uma2 family endonuclease